MLCALATLAALLVRFNFLGGGDGFCRLGDGMGLGTAVDFAYPLGIVSELLIAESVVLCPCMIKISDFTDTRINSTMASYIILSLPD